MLMRIRNADGTWKNDNKNGMSLDFSCNRRGCGADKRMALTLLATDACAVRVLR